MSGLTLTISSKGKPQSASVAAVKLSTTASETRSNSRKTSLPLGSRMLSEMPHLPTWLLLKLAPRLTLATLSWE